MKFPLPAGFLALALVSPSWAESGGPRPDRPPPGDHPPGPPVDRGWFRGKEGRNGKDARVHRPLGGFLSLPPEAKRAIFQSHDLDKDGKLNPEELDKARAELREKEIAHRREMIARFDKNKDGELNEEERKAMRLAWEDHLKESKEYLRKKFDTNGDGKVDNTEREAAELELRKKWQERRKEIMRRFDKDGDGTLNEAEKESAKEAIIPPPGERRPLRDGAPGTKPLPWLGDPKRPGRGPGPQEAGPPPRPPRAERPTDGMSGGPMFD